MGKTMTPPLAVVEWEDAGLIDVGPWVENEPAKYAPKMFIQVGFVLHDGDDGVILTHAWSPDLIAPRDQIPRGMIRKLTYIKQRK